MKQIGFLRLLLGMLLVACTPATQATPAGQGAAIVATGFGHGTAATSSVTPLPTPAPSLSAATSSPTATAPTPGATATPENVDTWSSVSPDGKWTAQGRMEGPFPDGDQQKYHTQLKVASVDGTTTWIAVDDWRPWGLGYDVPKPLEWSRNGQFLYFTDEGVPDGCALFAINSQLYRIDLAGGQVMVVAPAAGWGLSLSPDEATLAYISEGEARDLFFLELKTSTERRVPLKADQAGDIVWSPDSRALMLTLASHPCDTPNWTQSVVRVDAATLSQTTLIDSDKRLFSTVSWPEMDQVELRDKDGHAWWMDATTGHLAMKR